MRASLEQVVATGKRDILGPKRYDVETTVGSGEFQERHWSAINTPVLGPDGEVQLIIHRAEEVTGFLQQLRLPGERGVTGVRAEPEGAEAVETDVYVHMSQ